jgi:adenylate cyclase
VGDLINAAARVESLTKHYGALFLITREAFARLSAPPTVRLIDKAIVKGKTVPLELFEVKHSHSPLHFDETLERYNAAFAEYERGAFDIAERMFAALRDERQDKPSGLMAERCHELAMDPPEDWNGVYQLTSK